MLRFTIRDLLWLMVVVGLAITGATCNLQMVQIVKRANREAERSRRRADKAEKELLWLEEHQPLPTGP
jgi:hypothetical protein